MGTWRLPVEGFETSGARFLALRTRLMVNPADGAAKGQLPVLLRSGPEASPTSRVVEPRAGNRNRRREPGFSPAPQEPASS